MAWGYQLKITIEGSEPSIWRRVIVPDNITFWELDEIIETLFGWTHSHLYEFRSGSGERIFFDGEEDNSDVDTLIDAWMKKKRFTYTYDMGDCWVHIIQVEQIVERENRYAEVLEAQGPNMIEDCGGIWGFRKQRKYAEPFDMEAVNAEFRENELPEVPGMFFEDSAEKLEQLEEYIRSSVMPAKSLTDIFSQYTKEELTKISRLHKFRGYSKFNKSELAEWLKNQLLDKQYMTNMINAALEIEMDIFKRAIEKKGILIPTEMLEPSLFLCTYGGSICGYGFYQVPMDVQKRFQEICTPEFTKKHQRKNLIRNYCRAAVYLYGVVSVEKLEEIYKHYEKEELPRPVLDDILQNTVEKEEMAVQDGYLMDCDLQDNEYFQYVLREQKKYDYYLPETKEGFFVANAPEMQLPQEIGDRFQDFLMEKLHFQEEDAVEISYYIVEAIRMNAEEEELLYILEEYGYGLRSKKRVKEILSEIYKLEPYIRRWELCGHTANEVSPAPKQNSLFSAGSKIVPFSREAKVYPNDPCPCGSGKKYKHCCGKK